MKIRLYIRNKATIVAIRLCSGEGIDFEESFATRLLASDAVRIFVAYAAPTLYFSNNPYGRRKMEFLNGPLKEEVYCIFCSAKGFVDPDHPEKGLPSKERLGIGLKQALELARVTLYEIRVDKQHDYGSNWVTPSWQGRVNGRYLTSCAPKYVMRTQLQDLASLIQQKFVVLRLL
ncbi:hypothetical protein Tco_0780211 [Tanacetum coccineum]